MGSSRRVPDASDVAAVDRAFDVLRRTSPPTATRTPSACRCGWPDRSQLGNPPVRPDVLDLTDKTGTFAREATAIRRSCAACHHPIPDRGMAVVHRLSPTSAVLNRYHPECVETP